MIDNPEQAGRLFAKRQAALPLPARMTPELSAALRSGAATTPLNPACSITSINYAGDEGGVMCELDLLNESGKAIYVSITHLRFDPRLPMARDITDYQKHRVKRIRRGAG
jgi:hypothetical protein